MNKFEKWDMFEKKLNISKEQEEEIKLEMELIKTTIKIRENSNMSQNELSKKSGIMQPAIARLEKGRHSPSVNTLLKILIPMGYTLKIVPIRKK